MSATQRLNEELVRKARNQMRTATDPLERLRLTCLARGASGIKGLARQFRIIDDDGNKRLDRKEFHKGCRDFGAVLTDKEIDYIFDHMDADNSGCVNFDEFLVALRPPMSRTRVELIEQAFNKLDKNKDGDITVEDLKGVYCCKFHPKYQNGEWTKDQVFREFLKTFEAPETTDGVVTKEEFLNYYAGVSASIDNDAYFGLMMRTAYRL
ncbi:hypothetical protein BOX15_Mlig007177g2 [Macrostomum lignano]|uniref:EF-hand domain-containing protein n=1 Tax=Macrostomum lignano TaxID=282301 RepID=A0A267FSW1_9PLAT|nr:hypothetical protein BOX15_Mlig007177g2 [Macrostomum lignano]